LHVRYLTGVSIQGGFVAIILDEPVLPDAYPVYCGYIYVADGTMIRSPASGYVWQLKQELGAKEIRRYDGEGRRRKIQLKRSLFECCRDDAQR
jgi:hypothetical protein